MNIFIDTISSPAYLLLFDEEKKIRAEYAWDIKGKESSTLIPKLDAFLKENNQEYKDLENIVVVNGPGSFTGVRTTVLVVNTINYIIQKNIIPLSYFELFDGYPIIKSSSKRDCFIQFDEKTQIEIMKNEAIGEKLKENNVKKIYGSFSLLGEYGGDVKIVDKVDYKSIIEKVDLEGIQKKLRIEPLYIKKPNIS